MKAKDISLGGILVALTSIILYSASILPISTLTILTIASAIIPVCIIRSNVKTSIFVYISSSLIAFFLVPINIGLLYFIFFGVYGIIKYFIERMRKENIEIILKLLFFNIAFLIGFIIMQNILGINIVAGLETLVSKFVDTSTSLIASIVLWIVAQPIFLIYDYAMTMIITFYLERIHKVSK
ncbi:DUF2232 domain-containing protein [Clostridium celatum]|uniref:DUF2232 domain-containing protein n=1 Tax=Clostridium celatum DSM 1785 TaxID=545697 RepID=L1QNC1_9CLOT|nr:DUF2232 domain-containing protein [Clostridium celatum]EKY29416.1 hypothetical protein HMPREF0216_00277 [Clostridium celatum DSM 1785]MCE9655408.1 DUF2232 domain-containing protein [Clostridium celatum]MDU2266217.1 DUF2232 domain-containing protein [Clostridium celatum]MDU3721587.1 DUF2232 domain-containing protein [Clostridium celatum]MDU6296441.1 DUF2232 domain-containing protein [Clostridium celatum]